MFGLTAMLTLGGISLLGGCAPGSACVANCKCTSNCTVTFGLQEPTSTLGIDSQVLYSPQGVVAKLVAGGNAVAPTANMVQNFDPSVLTAQVTVQGGHLAGSTGIASVKVLDSNGKVLATKLAPYAIDGNTLYLQDPATLKSWLTTNRQVLINEGATGVYVSANLPMTQNQNSLGVQVKATVFYNGQAVGSVTNNYSAPVHIVRHTRCQPGMIVGVHCRIQ